MKHTPVYVEKNYNLGSSSPLRDGLILIGGVIAVVIAIYYALGVMVDVVAPHVPLDVELRLGTVFAEIPGTAELGAEHQRVQRVFDGLLAHVPDSAGFQLKMQRTDEVNAYAYPGRTIVVTTGFLDDIASENELAMVLAHELGHFHHRHHIRRLGRAGLFIIASLFLSAGDYSGSDVATGAMTVTELAFSREQEEEADDYGLALLRKTYGHIGGGVDFFQRSVNGAHDPGRLAYLTTHPSSGDRVARIREIAAREGWKTGETVAWPGAERPR